MSLRDAWTSRAFILKGSARRSIRVHIRDRFLVPKTGRGGMFSFGGDGAGTCLATNSRTNTSVFPRKDSSGVGRYRQMLLQFHAGVPIPARMGGVGETTAVAAMMADGHERCPALMTLRWLRLLARASQAPASATPLRALWALY